MLFDDEDDGVAPQFDAVDEYYFEVTKDKHVCFSILPLMFDEDDKVEDSDSENKVYLRGVMDNSLYQVYKKVVAWRVALDCEQPNILVLSSEGNWIKLLNPQKHYKDEIARSILITIQMIHFVRKPHGDKRRLWGQLWDHLNEMFNELDTKPSMDDLRKHHPLIKLFLERDPELMKLKILHRFIGDIAMTTRVTKTSGSKLQFTDSDYDDNEENSDSDYGDIGDSDNGVDTLCALCDDGGKIISCIGQCKRSFHPRKKDGRESRCKTLGYSSAEKLILIYARTVNICNTNVSNVENLNHQHSHMLRCFKCNNPTCRHFYHPKCAAKLLEPDPDGSCELAKKIMAGMSFTCPIHWCFKCKQMEDRTETKLQFATCRRCPKSYHRQCLPREISFETKDKNIKQRAWELPGITIIYCLDQKICKPTGNAKRGHINFPHIPENTKVRDLAKNDGKMVTKRKRRIDQCFKKSSRVLNSVTGTKISSSTMRSETEKREASGPKKERCSRTSSNIARKCVDLSVQPLQDKLMDNSPPVDKDPELGNETCRISDDTNVNGKENSSEHSGQGEEDPTNKDNSHENNERNDARGRLIVDLQAEVDISKLIPRAHISMVLGENADGLDSVSAQQKEVLMGGNQICPSMCEQESRSGNGKAGDGNGGHPDDYYRQITITDSIGTPDHVDGNPVVGKLLHVPHVDKITFTDRLHILPEYDCDKDREVNGGHAFQEDPNSSWCNVNNPETVGIHTSGDKLRREFKDKGADDNNTDLDDNKRCKHIEDGKEAHTDDSSHQYPSNHELDYQDCNFGHSGPKAPQCNDESSTAEVIGSKFRKNTGPSTIENSSNPTTIDRNSQEKETPRNHSPNRQRTYSGSYPSLQVSNNGAYQPRTEYGARSNYYSLASGPRCPAAVSVTDRYAPYLDQTNNRIRGCVASAALHTKMAKKNLFVKRGVETDANAVDQSKRLRTDGDYTHSPATVSMRGTAGYINAPRPHKPYAYPVPPVAMTSPSPVPGPITYAPVHNTKDNPPCNTLFVGNFGETVVEEELRSLFSVQPGYKQMKVVRRQGRSTICFIEFEDVNAATAVHRTLQGAVSPSSGRRGMRIQFSKNPFGRRKHSVGGLAGILNGGSAFCKLRAARRGVS